MVSLRRTIRPLEPAIAGLRSLGQGWAGHPSRSRRLLSLRSFARVPARGRIGDVTRWASRNTVCAPIALSLLKRRRPWFISPSNKALATVPLPSGMVGRFLKPASSCSKHEWPGLVTACDHVKRPLGLRLLTSRWPNSTGAPGKGGPPHIEHNACKRWHKQGGC